jgi:hypothetical protein
MWSCIGCSPWGLLLVRHRHDIRAPHSLIGDAAEVDAPDYDYDYDDCGKDDSAYWVPEISGSEGEHAKQNCSKLPGEVELIDGVVRVR